MKMENILIFGILFILDLGICIQQNLNRRQRDLGDEFKSLLDELVDVSTTTPKRTTVADDLKSILETVDGNINPSSSPPSSKSGITTTSSRPRVTTTPNTASTSTAVQTNSPPIPSSSKQTTSGGAQSILGAQTSSGAQTTSESLESNQSEAHTELPPPLSTENPVCELPDILSTYCMDLPPAVSSLSFWDIYYTLFSDVVLDELFINCSSGHWCLRDRFNYFEAILMEKTEMVMTSDVFTDVCQAVPGECLQGVVDMLSRSNCRTYGRVNFTKEAIDLICKLKKDTDLTSNCFEELLISLHVTVVDIYRDQNSKQTIEEGFVDDTCKTPEVEMSKTFVCLEDRCPNHATDLANFRSWKWFTSDVKVLQNECDFESDTCISKYRSSASNSLSGENESHTIGIAWTEPVSIHMMIGISVGTFVSVIALTVLAYVCWRSHRKAKKGKEGYSPLRNDEP